MAKVGAMKSGAPLGSDLGVRCRGGAMKIITAYLIRAHIGPFLFAFTALTGLLFLNAFAVRIVRGKATGDLCSRSTFLGVSTKRSTRSSAA